MTGSTRSSAAKTVRSIDPRLGCSSCKRKLPPTHPVEREQAHTPHPLSRKVNGLRFRQVSWLSLETRCASSLPAPSRSSIGGRSRRLRELHSGGTARDSHPLPYSPRISGHPKLKKFLKDPKTNPDATTAHQRSQTGGQISVEI